MTSRLTSTIIALGFLLSTFPSQAQYAYHSTAIAKAATISTDPDEGTNDLDYRTVHGVVQSNQGTLPGATVWLHDSNTIVVTNAEGEFELRVPVTAKTVRLTCAYGGLQEEDVTFASTEALGSVYLLRPKTATATTPSDK